MLWFSQMRKNEDWPQWLRNFMLTLLLSSVQACASGTQPASIPVSANVGGWWSGTSIASCMAFQTPAGRCNAQQKITFDLIQKESGFAGSYSCAYGNMVCRNGNNKGRIESVTTLGTDFTLLRVQLPDGTSCTFKGVFQESQVSGGYTCYGGAAIIEQGSWRASRDY